MPVNGRLRPTIALLSAATLLILQACQSDPEPTPERAETLDSLIRGGASVLWIGAHPDDEVEGGTLWLRACAELRNDCLLVSATDGAAGGCTQASVDTGVCPCPNRQRQCPEEVERRLQEFTRCVELFRATPLMLYWKEVEIEDYRDPGLVGASAAVLRSLLEERRPAILATHASKGAYGHPNHIYVNRAVRQAWQQLPEDRRPRFYYLVVPFSLDMEEPTDVFEGDQYSPILGMTYWEGVLMAADAHATQGVAASLRARPTQHASFFHLVDEQDLAVSP